MSTRIDKYDPDYLDDKLKGNFPLAETIIFLFILTIAYILWKNYPK